MTIFLTLAYLFFIGSCFGWILEVFFRKFFSSSNPERKWINPGFCVGPYLPLYGFGLCALFVLAKLSEDTGAPKYLMFAIMAVAMTVIEYLAGLLMLKVFKLRLWDYTDCWGNIQGLICPLFSFFWAVLGAVYYFLVHPKILSALQWLSENLAFSFVIGFFFGVFAIDVIYSSKLVARMRKFALDNQFVVRYESFKNHIHTRKLEAQEKIHFFLPFKSETSLLKHLEEFRKTELEKIKKIF